MASSQKKKCKGKNGCGKELPLEKFSKHANTPDGLQSSCKECVKAYDQKLYADPVAHKRKRDQIKLYNQTPAAIAKRKKNTIARNAKPLGKLRKSLKSALRDFVIGTADSPRNRALFGRTRAEMRAYIKSLMEPWMHWKNYGRNTGEYKKTWQFDHIIPFQAFETYEELEKNKKIMCWNKNIQPMCAKKNAEKKADFKPEDKEALIRRYYVEAVMEEIISIVAQGA